MTKHIAILTLAAALAACGGGGDEAPPATTAPSSPPVAVVKTNPSLTGVRIEMYGDSTTQGWIWEDKGEPYSLQALMPPNVTVVNEGVAGTSAVQLFNGTDGRHLPWIQQMANSAADIVTINFGMNDVLTTTPQDYATYLWQMVDIARQAGKIVVLQEPNPSCDPARVNLIQYVNQLDQIAQVKKVFIVEQYNLMIGMPDWQNLMADCIHPDKDKYPIKSLNTFLVVGPIVRDLLISRGLPLS